MKTFGRYTLRHKLGEGGMGVVYEVFDPVEDRILALKMVRDSTLGDVEAARLAREFRLLSTLRHPNLIRVHDSGLHDGVPFYTMERLQGTTQRDLWDALPLPGPDLWGPRNASLFGMLFALLDALEYLHQRGIVHRDLQPNNVMLLEDGTTRLIDFGLAREVVSDSHLTSSGKPLGTLLYSSPEQIDGHYVDARSDLYSFGVILYRLGDGHGDGTLGQVQRLLAVL